MMLSYRRFINEEYGKRRIFGGNSGYVGYSKSVRAVEAEENGLRNKSQMDRDFLDEVKNIIEEKTGKKSKLTLALIKKSLVNIRYDEWHHTSVYGNKTYYYSAETIADYFIEKGGDDIKNVNNKNTVDKNKILANVKSHYCPMIGNPNESGLEFKITDVDGNDCISILNWNDERIDNYLKDGVLFYGNKKDPVVMYNYVIDKDFSLDNCFSYMDNILDNYISLLKENEIYLYKNSDIILNDGRCLISSNYKDVLYHYHLQYNIVDDNGNVYRYIDYTSVDCNNYNDKIFLIKEKDDMDKIFQLMRDGKNNINDFKQYLKK